MTLAEPAARFAGALDNWVETERRIEFEGFAENKTGWQNADDER